uniref:Uncharacterized protein n=1 Tax=candidate division WOR-3 bacterium TaxID=2052148 RepID=A0A7C4GJ07_UNCW3
MELSRSLPERSAWVSWLRLGVTSERVVLPVTGPTTEIVAGPDDIARDCAEGGPEFSAGLVLDGRQLGSALSRGGRGMPHEFHSLGAEFVYPLAPLLNELRVQNGQLVSLADALNTIDERTIGQADLSLRRRWSEARELFIEGCAKAAELLFPEALGWLRKAEERYPTDFVIQFELGWVHLYGVSSGDDVVDLEKAEAHFRRAVRYGMGAARRRPDVAAPAAEAMLHLAIACRLLGQAEEALTLAGQAAEVNPKLAQAHYHKAKFAAGLDLPGPALAALRQALALDRRFGLTLATDSDLAPVSDSVVRLLQELRSEARVQADTALAELGILSAVRSDVTRQAARRSESLERLRQVVAEAGTIPAGAADFPGASFDMRMQFDNESREAQRALEKADKLLERAQRSVEEAEALSARALKIHQAGTWFAYHDVLHVAGEAAVALRRADANLADAAGYVKSCADRLPKLEDALPGLAAEAGANRRRHREWLARETLSKALGRMPKFAAVGALAALALRVAVYFVRAEYHDLAFNGLVNRAAAAAGLGALIGVGLAALWSLRRLLRT